MSTSIDQVPAINPGAELLEQRKKVIGPALSVSYERPLVILRGQGQYLYDEQGNEFLDCVNNVCHVGHCHPVVVAAGQSQMAALNTNTRYLHPLLIEYAQRLTATFPDGLDVCYFVNSGSEANELALRLAQTYTNNQQIIALEHGYHGNTQRLIDISHYKFSGIGGTGPGPLTSITPIPDVYKGKYRGDGAESTARYIADFKRLCESLTAKGAPPAAFIAESISGCGGQVPYPQGYLKQAAEVVRAHGGIFIADEVQVGFGRIGTHMWAFEPQEVFPDIVTLGKPMGNGHPIAAVITTHEIASAFDTGMEYFNTFGGNPVSCAIGLAVLDVIENEQLMDNALTVGNYFMHQLEQLKTEFALIGDVRGSGLFIGVELINNGDVDEPATDIANKIIEHLRERRILLSTDGPDANVLKIKPPLVINKTDVDHIIGALQSALHLVS